MENGTTDNLIDHPLTQRTNEKINGPSGNCVFIFQERRISSQLDILVPSFTSQNWSETSNIEEYLQK